MPNTIQKDLFAGKINSAYEQATQLLEEARSAAADKPKQVVALIAALEDFADAASATGQFEDALTAYEEARVLAEEHQPPAPCIKKDKSFDNDAQDAAMVAASAYWAQFHAKVALCQLALGDDIQSVNSINVASGMDEGHPTIQALTASALLRNARFNGIVYDADEAIKKAVAACAALDDKDELASVPLDVETAELHLLHGRLDDAEQSLEQITIKKLPAILAVRVHGLRALCQIAHGKKPATAVKAMETACADIDDSANEARIMQARVLSAAAYAAADYATAAGQADRFLALCDERYAGHDVDVHLAHTTAINAHLAAGNISEATRIAATAVEKINTVGQQHPLFPIIKELHARSLYADGRLVAAIKDLKVFARELGSLQMQDRYDHKRSISYAMAVLGLAEGDSETAINFAKEGLKAESALTAADAVASSTFLVGCLQDLAHNNEADKLRKLALACEMVLLDGIDFTDAEPIDALIAQNLFEGMREVIEDGEAVLWAQLPCGLALQLIKQRNSLGQTRQRCVSVFANSEMHSQVRQVLRLLRTQQMI